MKTSLTRFVLFVATLVLAAGSSSARKLVIQADVPSMSKYIEALDLGDIPAHKIMLGDIIYSNNTEQGFLDGSIAFGFTNMVSGTHKRDFVSAMLLAELNSNKLFDRYNDAMNWYKNYFDVLSKCAMASFGIPQWAPYKGDGENIVIANAAVDILGSTDIERAVAKAVVNSLSQDSTDRFKLFAASSTTDKAGNFQINLVDESAGLATVSISGYQMVTTDYQLQFLWSNWKASQITLQYTTATYSLSDSVWNTGLRDTIYKKVADYVDLYVMDLQF